MATKEKPVKSGQKTGGTKIGSKSPSTYPNVDSATRKGDTAPTKGGSKGAKNDGFAAIKGSQDWSISNQNKTEKKNAKTQTKTNTKGR